METKKITSEEITPRIPGVPEDAELVGFDGAVAYLRSTSRGLVYIAQGGSVWALPLDPRNDTPEESRESRSA
jgi:hypothetical protein